MTKSIDLNADYHSVCADCTRNAELSADCAECYTDDAYDGWFCDDCDLNPHACENCVLLPIIVSIMDKPVILLYNDVEYDWPIQWTVKRETETLISIDGWWILEDGLYLPINDESIEENTFCITDAAKRIETLLRMGAYVKK